MNERIQILASQAEDYADGIVDQGGEFHEAYTQKLAELIVRECAEAALAKGRASPYTDFRTGSYVISEYLLSRYGVEE
jgi:hypothetical protein